MSAFLLGDGHLDVFSSLPHEARLSDARAAFAISLFRRALDVGALAINAGPGFRSDTAPFGGVKESGLGREGVAYAVKEMQYLKTMYW